MNTFRTVRNGFLIFYVLSLEKFRQAVFRFGKSFNEIADVFMSLLLKNIKCSFYQKLISSLLSIGR